MSKHNTEDQKESISKMVRARISERFSNSRKKDCPSFIYCVLK